MPERARRWLFPWSRPSAPSVRKAGSGAPYPANDQHHAAKMGVASSCFTLRSNRNGDHVGSQAALPGIIQPPPLRDLHGHRRRREVHRRRMDAPRRHARAAVGPDSAVRHDDNATCVKRRLGKVSTSRTPGTAMSKFAAALAVRLSMSRLISTASVGVPASSAGKSETIANVSSSRPKSHAHRDRPTPRRR